MRRRVALGVCAAMCLAAACDQRTPPTAPSIGGPLFSATKADQGDTALLRRVTEINRQLAAKGFNAAIEAIDFFTIGKGRPGIRIHQAPFRWVPNDPRRLADATNITYLVSDHLAEAET